MRGKFFLLLLCLVICILVGSIFIALPVSAGNMLQTFPSLEGYTIYFTDSNGEASPFDRSQFGISRLGGLLWQLGAKIETLNMSGAIPEDADLIVIVGPNNDLLPDATARLWSYLEDSGSLLLMSDPTIGSGRNITGLNSNSALLTLLWSEMGIRFLEGGVVMPNPDDPRLLIDSLTTTIIDHSHPATAGITGDLGFYRARVVDVDGSIQQFQATPLVFSPETYYGETSYNDYILNGVADYSIENDLPYSRLPLAAVSVNPRTNTRVALIGNHSFATNGGGFRTSPSRSAAFVFPDNPRFLIQLMAWLMEADDVPTQEIPFPTPEATGTPIPTATPIVVNTDLAITISVNNAAPGQSDAIIYAITVTNNGPERSPRTMVNVTLPTSVTFASSKATTRSAYDDRNAVWDIGELLPQNSQTLSIAAVVNPGTSGTTITAGATVSSQVTLNDTDTTNNTASVDVTVVATEE